MLHEEMLDYLHKKGWKNPIDALEYWKKLNDGNPMVSPRPFNTVIRSLVSSKASSAFFERYFGGWVDLKTHIVSLFLLERKK